MGLTRLEHVMVDQARPSGGHVVARTPVDAELQAALDETSEPTPLPSFADVANWPEFRVLFAGRMASLPGRALATSAVSARNHALPGPAGLGLSVRVYEPLARAAGRLPAVLFVHGGGFAAGDLDLDDPRCRHYASQTPCVVVSVDYRLAPEDPFPAGFEDVLWCWDWMTSHASDLKIDADRAAIAGSSAGGALAAGACLALGGRPGSRPALLLLLHAVLDDRLQTRSSREYTGTPSWDSASNRFMWRQYLSLPRPARWAPEHAAPARAQSLAVMPPTFIATTDNDPLEDEGKAFATRLADGDRLVGAHHQDGGFHAFDTFAPASRLGREALDRQVAVLRARLARG
jgi:acetyl esterase